MSFVDYFHFIDPVDLQLHALFGRASHPVDRFGQGVRTVGFYGHVFTGFMQAVDQGVVYPKGRFASRKDNGYGRIFLNFGDDFIIGEAEDAPGFFDAAGIESPGLSCAPAIGEYLAGMIEEKAGFGKNPNFNPIRKGIVKAARLNTEERAELIRKNPAYGAIVCRCETISEGEIVDAITRTLGARSMDGIKRRVRQGMGRCQAGFCTPRAMEILSRETGIPITEICKNRKGSEMIKGEEA